MRRVVMFQREDCGTARRTRVVNCGGYDLMVSVGCLKSARHREDEVYIIRNIENVVVNEHFPQFIQIRQIHLPPAL